jgi:integrase
MQAKLSSTTIKQLEPRDKPYEVVDSEIKGFLLRVQPTGRKTFYFTYRTRTGKRKRIKIGVLGTSKTATQARDGATAYAGQVAEGIDIQGEKVAGRREAQEQEKNTLYIFMTEVYKPWALSNLKSGQQTIDSVTRSFPDLLNRPMNDIQLKGIERWRSDKLASGLKATTLNRIANALRGVLTKAVEWHAIPEHPLAKLKNLKVDEGKKSRYLLEEEETRLYATLATRDGELKATRSRGNDFREKRGYALMQDLAQFEYGDRMTPLITLSLKTGMRRGEAFDLRWGDVDFDNKLVTIKGENAKSSKTRHIPLSPIAFNALKMWQNQASNGNGRVFPSDDGGRLNNVKRSWASILKGASIEEFRWHDMRHDFASKLVMKGVPLNTVRELCGHASLNTTLRYAHLAPDHKSDAVALIG